MRSSSKISENTRVRKAGTIRSGTHFLVRLWKFPNNHKVVKPSTVAGMVESIIGCKWSLSSANGSSGDRPGAMERAIDGLTTKVLNERLRKLVEFCNDMATLRFPRVEYKLTAFGEKFVHIQRNRETQPRNRARFN